MRRLVLRPLSSGAVEELADGHGADAGAVLAATAGNPFFVTEVLANPGVEVPATVRDAVLARLGGLSEPTQRALELLSTVPGQAERWLVEALLGGDTTALDEAERRGVLQADPGHVWFRHELARRAVERQRSSTARVAGNRRVLAELARRPGVELSRLTHHAHQAGDPEAVVRHGLAAAREAAGAGAFTEALAHYELVLRWSASCRTPSGRPCWRRASGCSTTSPASTRRWPAPARWSPCASGPATRPRSRQALTTLSRMRYMAERPGRLRAGRDPRRGPAGTARRPAPAGPRLHLPGRHHEAHRPPRRGHRPGRQALELGERTGQRDVVAHSLNYLGAALLDLGDPGGAAHLRRSAEVARSAPTTSTPSGLHQPGRGAVPPGPPSASSTSRWPRGWPTPASTGSPPTSTTWRRTAACC